MTETKKLYVQFGAGNEAIPGWLNFDSSMTLRIQKMFLVGRLLRSRLNCVFDDDIRYGDIVRGLPVPLESVDGLFGSHILEHLTYTDFSAALKNSYSCLKPGGRFRIIVPDLAAYIIRYQEAKTSEDAVRRRRAAYEFCKDTGLGGEAARRTLFARALDCFSNSRHHWMWDYEGLAHALADHGFTGITRFKKGACEDNMFLQLERDHQFGDGKMVYGLAVECRKP